MIFSSPYFSTIPADPQKITLVGESKSDKIVKQIVTRFGDGGILVILVMLQIWSKKTENSDLCVLDDYLLWVYIHYKRQSNGQA